jgi:hypothetical protein
MGDDTFKNFTKTTVITTVVTLADEDGYVGYTQTTTETTTETVVARRIAAPTKNV